MDWPTFLVKSNLENHNSRAGNLEEEDHENGNAFDIVDQNNDDVEIHDSEEDALEPKEPNDNFPVCDDMADFKNYSEIYLKITPLS